MSVNLPCPLGPLCCVLDLEFRGRSGLYFAETHNSPRGRYMPTVGLVSWLLLDSLAKIIPSEMFSVVFYCIIGQFRCYYSLPRGGANAGQHEKETHKRVKRKTILGLQVAINILEITFFWQNLKMCHDIFHS